MIPALFGCVPLLPPSTTVITSLNLKGGVGKTHLCWLFASVCQQRKKRCLIVDLDQQSNITQSLLPEHADPSGIELVFDATADIHQSCKECNPPGMPAGKSGPGNRSHQTLNK